MATRIWWTPKERVDIAALSFRIRQNSSEISDLECVRRAMRDLLPEDKHRSLSQMTQVAFVSAFWSRLIKGIDIYLDLQETVEVAPVVEKKPVDPLARAAQQQASFENFQARLNTVAKAAGYQSAVTWCHEKCDISRQSVYNWRNMQKTPGHKSLAVLSDISGKSIAWWQGEEADEDEVVESDAEQRYEFDPIEVQVNHKPQPLPAKIDWPKAIEPVVNPLHAVPQKPATLESLTTEMLAQELVARLLKAVDTSTLRALIREEVNTVLERRLPGILAPDEYVEPQVEKPVEHAKLIKVCVIGLLGKQENLLKAEYKGKIDFHFLSGGEGAQRVKNTASIMDLTIRTKFVKGVIGSMKGVPNFVHAQSLDSVRNLIHGRFAVKSLKG